MKKGFFRIIALIAISTISLVSCDNSECLCTQSWPGGQTEFVESMDDYGVTSCDKLGRELHVNSNAPEGYYYNCVEE